MRPLSFFLALLLSAPASAQGAAPELICDSDTKVVFRSGWFGSSSVRLENRFHFEFPWTGREPRTSGRQIKGDRPANSGSEPEPDEISALPDNAVFSTFRESSANRLQIERSLLSRNEQDGIVILEQAGGEPRLSVYHCRSR